MAKLEGGGVAWRLALVAIAVLLACVQQAAGAKGALSASAFDYESELVRKQRDVTAGRGAAAWCGLNGLCLPATSCHQRLLFRLPPLPCPALPQPALPAS